MHAPCLAARLRHVLAARPRKSIDAPRLLARLLLAEADEDRVDSCLAGPDNRTPSPRD